MKSVMTTLYFSWIQLKRNFRDPLTLGVLFAIPVLLLLLFGSFATGDSISLKVAVINHSDEEFANEFTKNLEQVEVFNQSEESLSTDDAVEKMNAGDLDGIVELPEDFGAVGENNTPGGTVKVYFDEANAQTSEIFTSVMNSVVDSTNQTLNPVPMALTLERVPTRSSEASAIDYLFSIFTGMAILMVGIFGVTSAIAAERQKGILRRLKITPFSGSQLIIGEMLCFLVIGAAAIAAMTAVAMTMFGLNLQGSWLVYGVFCFIALILMLGFGLAIGGRAKSTGQADMMGQIVFMTCLAFSGVWFPRALMPEWLRSITDFLPLVPVIDGIRYITTEGMNLVQLMPQLSLIFAWMVVVYAIGILLFRFE